MVSKFNRNLIGILYIKFFVLDIEKKFPLRQKELYHLRGNHLKHPQTPYNLVLIKSKHTTNFPFCVPISKLPPWLKRKHVSLEVTIGSQ